MDGKGGQSAAFHGCLLESSCVMPLAAPVRNAGPRLRPPQRQRRAYYTKLTCSIVAPNRRNRPVVARNLQTRRQKEDSPEPPLARESRLGPPLPCAAKCHPLSAAVDGKQRLPRQCSGVSRHWCCPAYPFGARFYRDYPRLSQQRELGERRLQWLTAAPVLLPNSRPP